LGPVSVTGSGTIAPAGGGSGTLTATSAPLTASTTVALDLNGTAAAVHDRLAVTGALNVGGAELTLALGFAPVATNSFTLVTAPGGVTGTFARLADLATFDLGGKRFQIDDSATTAVVTDVTPVFTWDGGAADNNWASGLHWVRDVAPAAGSDLVFPSSVSDFAGGDQLPGRNCLCRAAVRRRLHHLRKRANPSEQAG
jgi:hypothetical protein